MFAHLPKCKCYKIPNVFRCNPPKISPHISLFKLSMPRPVSGGQFSYKPADLLVIFLFKHFKKDFGRQAVWTLLVWLWACLMGLTQRLAPPNELNSLDDPFFFCQGITFSVNKRYKTKTIKWLNCAKTERPSVTVLNARKSYVNA